MKTLKILFVCVHNSARSQMAEAWANHMAPDNVRAESAGLEPGVLNPLAVEVMKEAGLDISNKETRSVFDLFKEGRLYTHVITVCDEVSAERCPIFPGIVARKHWSFADPSSFTGSDKEKLAAIREIRDLIKKKIAGFLKDIGIEPKA